MSYAEDLVFRSLRLVVPQEEIVRNFRPDVLRNPVTGRNLEMDFFLPRAAIGIEVQGPHHYDDFRQQARDETKQELAEKAGIYLILLSILQVTPHTLRNKLLTASRVQGVYLGLANSDPSWLEVNKEKAAYRNAILRRYGEGPCCVPPSRPSQKDFQSYDQTEDQKLRLLHCLYVTISFKKKGLVRAAVIDVKDRCVTVRLLGSSLVIDVGLKDVKRIHRSF